jgi:hypothetical protein
MEIFRMKQKCCHIKLKIKSVASVHERIPTERPPLVGEVSANVCGSESATWSAWQMSTAVFSAFETRILSHSIPIFYNISTRYFYLSTAEVSSFLHLSSLLNTDARYYDLHSLNCKCTMLYWTCGSCCYTNSLIFSETCPFFIQFCLVVYPFLQETSLLVFMQPALLSHLVFIPFVLLLKSLMPVAVWNFD